MQAYFLLFLDLLKSDSLNNRLDLSSSESDERKVIHPVMNSESTIRNDQKSSSNRIKNTGPIKSETNWMNSDESFINSEELPIKPDGSMKKVRISLASSEQRSLLLQENTNNHDPKLLEHPKLSEHKNTSQASDSTNKRRRRNRRRPESSPITNDTPYVIHHFGDCRIVNVDITDPNISVNDSATNRNPSDLAENEERIPKQVG